MGKRIGLAIVIGVVAGILTALVGIVLIAFGLGEIGAFVRSIAPLVGLLAAVWYFLTGQTPAI